MQVVVSVVVLKNGPIKTRAISTRDESKAVSIGWPGPSVQHSTLSHLVWDHDSRYHRLNMELSAIHVHSCTHWLRPRNAPPPHAFGLVYEGAIGQPRRTTSLCDPLVNTDCTLALGNFVQPGMGVDSDWSMLENLRYHLPLIHCSWAGWVWSKSFTNYFTNGFFLHVQEK